MGLSGFKHSCVVLLGFVALTSACSTQSETVLTTGEGERGQLRLPLLTAEEDTFRLSQAIFNIENQSGTRVVSLDSDSDPDAEELDAELAVGAYRSRLESGWVLQRLEDDGDVVPVNAALLTPNPTPFEIQNGNVTELGYTFSTDEGEITLGSGQVSISIDVVDKPIPATCNPLSNFECRDGLTCLLAGSSGGTYCAAPGDLPVGAACSSEQCVAGAQCLALDKANPEQRTCAAFCNVQGPAFGCNCTNVGARDTNLGVCTPPPAGSCDLLTQTGCDGGQACQYETGSFGACGTPGSGVQGESCEQDDDCAPGFDCLDRFFGEPKQCQAFCDTSQFSGGVCGFSFCGSVGTGNVGRCFN